jgi:hypothetical protein
MPGGAAFISADVPHRNYVTHAWLDTSARK